MILDYKHLFSCVFMIFLWSPLWCARYDDSLLADNDGDQLPFSDLFFDQSDENLWLMCGAPEDQYNPQEFSDLVFMPDQCFISNPDQGFISNPDQGFIPNVVQQPPVSFDVQEGQSSLLVGYHSRVFSKEKAPPAKKLSVRERTSKLMEYLSEGKVNFCSLKDGIYTGCTSHIFQLDILQAMHRGADIREEGGYYHCVGEFNRSYKPPQNVAVAMFNLLKKPDRTIFDLRFQLYRAGYIDYSPEHLADLEKAFCVGDVHPYRVELYAKDNSNLADILVEKWKKVEHCATKLELNASLQELHKELTASGQGLSQKHRQVLRRLWELKDTKNLELLRSLKKNDVPQMEVRPLKPNGGGKRKETILKFLSDHKNEAVSIDTLFQNVDFLQETNRRRSVIFRATLMLAINGVPIIYDKDTQSVAFVDEIPPLVQLPKNTNLLTMLYDLLKKHNTNLSTLETAYYAYRRGYWPYGFPERVYSEFCRVINNYKIFLVIHKYIGAEHCDGQYKTATIPGCIVFKHSPGEGESQGFFYYKGKDADVHQEGLDASTAAKLFEKTEEFAVFVSYVRASCPDNMTVLEKERIVQSCVCANKLTQKLLWSLCESFGMRQKQEMWDVACTLTQNTGEGRLLYDPKTSLFSWDRTCSYRALTEVEQVVNIFVLQDIYPDMAHHELVYMVAQNGGNPNTIVIQKVFYGLELLGFRPESESFCVLSRDILKSMLASRAECVESKRDAYEIALEVYSWLGSGAMVALWKNHLTTCGKTLQEVMSEEERSPPTKRKKLEGPQKNPAAILERDIPELKPFLLANIL